MSTSTRRKRAHSEPNHYPLPICRVKDCKQPAVLYSCQGLCLGHWSKEFHLGYRFPRKSKKQR